MFCKVKIAKLQPKNSNNCKNTTQQMTTAIWRMSARLNKHIIFLILNVPRNKQNEMGTHYLWRYKNTIITIHYYWIACLYDLIIITKSYADLERVSSTLADNSLSNLPNSLDHTQPHSIIANLQYCVDSSNTGKLYGCLKRHKAFFLAFSCFFQITGLLQTFFWIYTQIPSEPLNGV